MLRYGINVPVNETNIKEVIKWMVLSYSKDAKNYVIS
jgi:hypothetical protein